MTLETKRGNTNLSQTVTSTAVPQGGTSLLTTALIDSQWFVPLEREGLQNLLTERKIIRAAQKKTKS